MFQWTSCDPLYSFTRLLLRKSLDAAHFICDPRITKELWDPSYQDHRLASLHQRPFSCWYKSQLQILDVRLTSLKVESLISAMNNHSKLPTSICVDLGKNQKMYSSIMNKNITRKEKGRTHLLFLQILF